MCEQLWDLRSKRSVHTLGEQYQVLAVAFGEEGDQVYTGGIENSLKVRLQRLTPSYAAPFMCRSGTWPGEIPPAEIL